MAKRRMFSLDIVDSDAFLDMPTSSQLLYFHLGMRADDDGFVGNPKKIVRSIGVNDDDYKILISKRFILIFESGVIVMKHWRINNLLRGDRYNETQYLDEKKTIFLKENGSYTDLATNGIPIPNQMAPQYSIGKDSKGYINNKNSKINEHTCYDGTEVIRQYGKWVLKSDVTKTVSMKAYPELTKL